MSIIDTQYNPLGREVAYPDRYDASLLFAIPRAQGRSALGIDAAALPFIGHDRWQAYELSWLDARGKPCVAMASVIVPADSPNLIESKSFKLYLNSYNRERMVDAEALRARIVADLSACARAPVTMHFAASKMDDASSAHVDDDACIDLDALDLDIDDYGPPNPQHLRTDGDVDGETNIAQRFRSRLLKSNCPVTGQPDWASIDIDLQGPRINADGLLRYIVSFRDHAEFHEQCVERVFIDLMRECRPSRLSVQARYTRRGGLDINPWRATPGMPPPSPTRDPRQ